MSYSFSNRLARVRRLVAAPLLALFALSAPSAFAIQFDHQTSGLWSQLGIGARRAWNIEYIKTGPEAGLVFVVGYVYDDANGNVPIWYQGAQSVVDGQFNVSVTLELVSGGSFGAGAGAPMTIDANYATVDITLNTCTSADFEFGGPNLANWSGEFTRSATAGGPIGYDTCVYQQEFTACPAFSQAAAFPRTCIITGTYTNDITLTNNIIWVLSGGVNIGDPATTENTNTIFIEAGTRIIGSGGTDALFIQRGARIFALGQPYAPIVMTSPLTASEGASSGDWGGAVINGKGILNSCENPTPQAPCTSAGEGDSGNYGGSDPYDNSGIMRYVRIQFAGIKFTDENELNGLALQGVGMGSTFEFIQVHRNADDGIEAYGGNPFLKYVLLTDIEDDSFDWTQGYQGGAQYMLILQSQGEIVPADRGMEMDNLGSAPGREPRAQPQIANVTIKGNPGSLGLNPRAGTGGNYHGVIVDGSASCLDIDTAETFTAAGTPEAPTGVLTFEHMLFNCTTNVVEDDEDGPDPFSTQDFLDAFAGNVNGPTGMNGGYIPSENADYREGAEPDPAVFNPLFFDQVPYKGSVWSADSDWTNFWSEFMQDWRD